MNHMYSQDRNKSSDHHPQLHSVHDIQRSHRSSIKVITNLVQEKQKRHSYKITHALSLIQCHDLIIPTTTKEEVE